MSGYTNTALQKSQSLFYSKVSLVKVNTILDSINIWFGQ